MWRSFIHFPHFVLLHHIFSKNIQSLVRVHGYNNFSNVRVNSFLLKPKFQIVHESLFGDFVQKDKVTNTKFSTFLLCHFNFCLPTGLCQVNILTRILSRVTILNKQWLAKQNNSCQFWPMNAIVSFLAQQTNGDHRVGVICVCNVTKKRYIGILSPECFHVWLFLFTFDKNDVVLSAAFVKSVKAWYSHNFTTKQNCADCYKKCEKLKPE